MKIRMLRDYTYELDAATSRTLHRGQVLAVEDDLCKAAVAAKAAVRVDPPAAENPGGTEQKK